MVAFNNYPKTLPDGARLRGQEVTCARGVEPLRAGRPRAEAGGWLVAGQHSHPWTWLHIYTEYLDIFTQNIYISTHSF